MPIKIGELTLYSVKEMSKKLGITPMTLRTYFREGRIKAQKMAGKWYVSEDSLKRFFLEGDESTGITDEGGHDE